MRIELYEVLVDRNAPQGEATTCTRVTPLDLPEGTCVAEALALAGKRVTPTMGMSVFGRRIQEMEVLHEGDRLELSPALLVDPREARRRRAERQGDVRVVTCGRHGGRRGATHGQE